jgi:hypothetical protein
MTADGPADLSQGSSLIQQEQHPDSSPHPLAVLLTAKPIQAALVARTNAGRIAREAGFDHYVAVATLGRDARLLAGLLQITAPSGYQARVPALAAGSVGDGTEYRAKDIPGRKLARGRF